MGQSSTKQAIEEPIRKSTSTSTLGTFKAKKYLTRVELWSLKNIFQDLKTTFPDGFHCIEPKKFLVISIHVIFKAVLTLTKRNI
jgi:hypothetical protein